MALASSCFPCEPSPFHIFQTWSKKRLATSFFCVTFYRSHRWWEARSDSKNAPRANKGKFTKELKISTKREKSRVVKKQNGEKKREDEAEETGSWFYDSHPSWNLLVRSFSSRHEQKHEQILMAEARRNYVVRAQSTCCMMRNFTDSFPAHSTI